MHLAKESGNRTPKCQQVEWRSGLSDQGRARQSRRHDRSRQGNRERNKHDHTDTWNAPVVERREAHQQKQKPDRHPKRKAIN